MELPITNANATEEAVLHMDDQELRTVVFALDAYRDKLREMVRESEGHPAEHENNAFCYGVLADIERILFNIFENHLPKDKEVVQRWLDVTI
jgi:hypothetical protein